MRAAQSQANNAQLQAGSTAANAGSNAADINSTLAPFLERELSNPQGFSQAQTTQMLNAGEAGAGGANSGITGQANLTAARTNNQGGFSTALDDAARQRGKQAAGVSEGVAANNANLQEDQQQNAEKGLQSMYGTDIDSQLKALGLQNQDINSEVNAGKSGWLQNALGVMGAINGAASGAGSLGVGFGAGKFNPFTQRLTPGGKG